MSKKSKNKTPDRQVRFKDSWQLYKRLLRYVKPHLLAFEMSVLGYLIFAATAVATAQWLGWTVDAIESQNYDQLRILSPLLCVVIVVVRGIGGIMGSYGINHVVHKVRCEMVGHLLDLPVSYYDRSTAGKIVSKVTYDVTQITGAASNALTSSAVSSGSTLALSPPCGATERQVVLPTGNNLYHRPPLSSRIGPKLKRYWLPGIEYRLMRQP